MSKIQKNNQLMNFLSILMLISFMFLNGCATTQVSDDIEVSEEESEVDPYEGFNRSMYGFNNGLDNYVAEPISNAYTWVTPEFVQAGVGNFFENLGNITVVINDLLQGKLQQGGEDTGRFVINSTVGLLGLFDVAQHIGLEQNNEDFGQTLAVWGVPTGPYLVLPFLGPTTVRGVPGTAVDMATNPVTYTGMPVVLPIQALSVVNTRANAEGALQFIDEAALDPYIFTRESYLQWRHHLATDGAEDASYDVMADFEDELYDDDEEDLLESIDEEQSDSLSSINIEEPVTDDKQIEFEVISGEEIQDELVPVQNDYQ